MSTTHRLSLLCYNVLLPIGLVVAAPGALMKMRRRGGRLSDLIQRLGFLPPETIAAIEALPSGGNRFWVHAVSVGEVNIASKMLTTLLNEQPDAGIVITSTTPTGYALAMDFAARHRGRVVPLYSPLDLPLVARRMLDLIRPAQLVLVEAEVWPNLVTQASRRGVTVSLINARLSPRSEKRFHHFGFLVKPIFALLNRVLVQDPEDGPRWHALGVRRERIQHTGSVKFDPDGPAVPSPQVEQFKRLLAEAGIGSDQPVLLAASTHAGEEFEIARVFQKLRSSITDLVLILVPRHVERTNEVIESLASLQLQPRRRSQLPQSSRSSSESVSCIVIDTTGELRAWQHLATVVVVGKSFLATGGQNPAEAVMAGKPVVWGPHMENFEALAALLLRSSAAVQVADFNDLEGTCLRLLQDRAACERMAAAGSAALAIHHGATRKTVAALLCSD